MVKYGLLLICIIAMVLCMWVVYRRIYTTRGGTVIILNGPSSSGKSSIQKEFQTLMLPNLWIKCGIDNLFDKPMPDISLDNLEFWQSPNPIRWVENTKDLHHHTVITLYTGPQGEHVAYGMNTALAAYAQEGCNIIVDYIAYKKEWIDDLCHKLKNSNVYWVKVGIPLTVLEERERARATSPQGHARSHYDTVYGKQVYDLEVNADKDTPHAIARIIKDTFNL